MANNTTATNELLPAPLVITPEAMLDHWQAHRRLTRRMIEAFPEDALFNFSIGGMRPFASMVVEMIDLAGPGMEGVVSGQWKTLNEMDHFAETPVFKTRQAILRRWDEVTAQIEALWPQIPPHRLQEMDKAFGQFEGPVYGFILYFIDNEIHHRGQGYVYLRALGVEPPAFWDR